MFGFALMRRGSANTPLNFHCCRINTRFGGINAGVTSEALKSLGESFMVVGKSLLE
jgi:hypothetical protein